MKVKSIIITTLLSLFIVSVLWAQDKYEYASIDYFAYSAKTGTIAISMDGKYQEEKVKIEEGFISQNLTPVLAKVNELAESGWEVYNNSIM